MVRPWRDDDAAIREERKDFWRLFLRDPSSRTRYYCWKLARAKTDRARRRDVLVVGLLISGFGAPRALPLVAEQHARLRRDRVMRRRQRELVVERGTLPRFLEREKGFEPSTSTLATG